MIRICAPLLSWLLLLTVFGLDVPVIHDHRDDGPALYDEECALATLALAHAGLPTPVAPDAAPPLLTNDPLPHAVPLRPPSRADLRATARAPPAA